MRRTLNYVTCSACCTRGFPSTWHLVLRVNWLSGPPASRVTIALRCQCVAHWSYSPLHTLCCRPWPRGASSSSTRKCDQPFPTTGQRFSITSDGAYSESTDCIVTVFCCRPRSLRRHCPCCPGNGKNRIP